jgi:hypothetical protein
LKINIRIIQIISYYPSCVGGMQNVAGEISERLALKGNQVEIFNSDIIILECMQDDIEKIYNIHHGEFGYSKIRNIGKNSKRGIIDIYNQRSNFHL